MGVEAYAARPDGSGTGLGLFSEMDPPYIDAC